MSGKLLYAFASSGSSPLKSLTSNFYISVKRYSKEAGNESRSHIMEEKAPSTADEFMRVAEEKAQGLTSQTFDKVKDAVGEAATASGPVDSEHAKQIFEETPHSAATSKEKSRRTGDEEPSLPRSA